MGDCYESTPRTPIRGWNPEGWGMGPIALGLVPATGTPATTGPGRRLSPPATPPTHNQSRSPPPGRGAPGNARSPATGNSRGPHGPANYDGSGLPAGRPTSGPLRWNPHPGRRRGRQAPLPPRPATCRASEEAAGPRPAPPAPGPRAPRRCTSGCTLPEHCRSATGSSSHHRSRRRS